LLAASDTDDGEWTLPAHGYDGNRYVASTQLTRESVRRLSLAWQVRLPDDGMMESAPIVAGGTAYVTTGHDAVYALDAQTGTQKWSFLYHPSHIIALAANRGVSLSGGKLFLGTLDGHVIALSAATGRVLWDVVGVHDQANSFYSMAPIPYRNLVLIGVSDGDWGGIGYVSAFDVNSGKRVWDWQTIPRPGAPGHETWSGSSWERGGGAVWGGLTIDPARATLYIDVGNPQPDLIGDQRVGANLYTDSMVALDIGGRGAPRLKWYYQFVPHDTHDWDPAMPPLRFTGSVAGVPRELVAAGDKAGNVWVLDALTGTLVERAVVSTQTMQTAEPAASGVLACPGTNGGVQYNGGAYLPSTNALYVPSTDQCELFSAGQTATYVPGALYTGGDAKVVGPSTGWMNAISIADGHFLWRRKVSLPELGGALVFDGGLVFTGQLDGRFVAYDAASGEILWQFATGEPIKAPPSSYVVDGRPYVIVGSGPPGLNFSLPGVPADAKTALISSFTLR
jgi:alcohol dehydrogenase (cytochrome c)